jgi:hypothetical protein
MRSSQPPKLATWILQRFASGRDKEPLLGDLVEEYNSGRSRSWFWRQMITAVLVDSYSQVRIHYVLAARAIAVGMATSLLCGILLLRGWMAFWKFLSEYWPTSSYLWNSSMLLELVAASVTGIAVGWIVGRFHRPYHLTMVFLYIAWCTAWSLPWVVPELSRLISDSLGHRRYVPYLILLVARMVIWATGAMVGGLLSAPSPASSPTKHTGASA